MKTDPKMISRILRSKRDEFAKSAAETEKAEGGTSTKPVTVPGAQAKDTDYKQPKGAKGNKDGNTADPIPDDNKTSIDNANGKGTADCGDNANGKAISKAAQVKARLQAMVQSSNEQQVVQEHSAQPEVNDYDLSQEALAKMASVILSTEEGALVANELLEKNAGEQAARDMITEAFAAAEYQDSLAKEASYNEDHEDMEKYASEVEMIKTATVDTISETAADIADALANEGLEEYDADSIIKAAAVHQSYAQENSELFQHDIVKQAYAQGMDDAAAVQDAMAAGANPELPLGGEDITIEKVQAVLEQLLQAGEIDEEDAIAILQELVGEGAPAEEAPMGEAPAEEAPMEEAPVA